MSEKGICIWDEGIPINEEEREKIFEKGFRGESGSKISGSGYHYKRSGRCSFQKLYSGKRLQ